MLQNLLIYRLLIFNACAAAVTVWLYQMGQVAPLFMQDSSRITFVIAGLFAIGLASIFIRARKVSRQLNLLRAAQSDFDLGRARAGFNAKKFFAKSAHIGSICQWLVLLGLLGTVIGFRESLESIDLNTFSSATGTQTSLVAMMGGIFIANGATIVGIYAALYLDICRRMLHTATVSAAEFER